jgi:hypothetical protein
MAANYAMAAQIVAAKRHAQLVSATVPLFRRVHPSFLQPDNRSNQLRFRVLAMASESGNQGAPSALNKLKNALGLPGGGFGGHAINTHPRDSHALGRQDSLPGEQLRLRGCGLGATLNVPPPDSSSPLPPRSVASFAHSAFFCSAQRVSCSAVQC